jgi:hypothetical protein
MNPRASTIEAAALGFGLCLTVYGASHAISEFGNYRQARGFAYEFRQQDNSDGGALLEAYASSDRRAWVVDGLLATGGLATVVVAGGLVVSRRREMDY